MTSPGTDSATGISDITTTFPNPAHAATMIAIPTAHAAIPSEPPRRSMPELAGGSAADEG